MTWEQMEAEARTKIADLLYEEWGEPTDDELVVISFPHLERMERLQGRSQEKQAL